MELKRIFIGKDKCELCRAKGEYIIAVSRLSIKSKICICQPCLERMYRLIGETITPKSIETIKRKNNG